jgi:hypothetical protein
MDDTLRSKTLELLDRHVDTRITVPPEGGRSVGSDRHMARLELRCGCIKNLILGTRLVPRLTRNGAYGLRRLGRVLKVVRE